MRRTERALVAEYRELLGALVTALRSGEIDRDRLDAAVALAELPDMVRGYESIKMANVERYRAELSRQRGALGV